MNAPVTVSELPLELKHPFRIAHGTSTRRVNALVRIGDGLGEASLPPYYPHSVDDIRAYIDSLDPGHLPANDAFPVRSFAAALPDGPAPARAAVDMALHDLWGRELGHPLYRLLGIDPDAAPPSAITIPIPESGNDLRDRIRRLGPVRQLKLKLGSPDPAFDIELARTAAKTFAGDVCVDANSAWPVDVASDVIPRLAKASLLFIEQPIDSHSPRDWHELRARLPDGMPPLIADESHQSAEDVPGLAGAADGINIKLAKCGGIHQALRCIAVARALDMSVMIGCMIESSVAVSAAAQLAGLADYLDLDASLHLADDPFRGAAFIEDRIRPSGDPGLGVRPA